MLQPEVALQHCKSQENSILIKCFMLLSCVCKHVFFVYRKRILPFGIESKLRAIAFLMTLMLWSMPNNRRSSWAMWVHFYMASPLFKISIIQKNCYGHIYWIYCDFFLQVKYKEDYEKFKSLYSLPKCLEDDPATARCIKAGKLNLDVCDIFGYVPVFYIIATAIFF